MIDLIKKFERKLVKQNLCQSNKIFFGALDDQLYWNAVSNETSLIEKIFSHLNISSILFATPAEPYFTILNALASEAHEGHFIPEDSETRTFFHDIPVASTFDIPYIIAALKRRRSIFIKNQGIITYGTIGPEQAFVVYSSVCFSSYVKFFCDILYKKLPTNYLKIAQLEAQNYVNQLALNLCNVSLKKGPFCTRDEILSAIIEAGKATVDCRLVDSYFGNISYCDGTSIFISQTGSSLDELTGCIDICPLDGSSCVGITASSEYTAHREIYTKTNARAILHGHPKFSVIISMQCTKSECNLKGKCHNQCPHTRFICDVPIVPGEIGTGTFGLCNTVPKALEYSNAAIVYGHGIFTKGMDFSEAFNTMAEIEMLCAKQYLKILESLNY